MKEAETYFVRYTPHSHSEIQRDWRFAPLMANGEEQPMWEVTRQVRLGEIINDFQFLNPEGIFLAHKMGDPNDMVWDLGMGEGRDGYKGKHFYKPVLVFIPRNKWRTLWEAVKGLFK